MLRHLSIYFAIRLMNGLVALIALVVLTRLMDATQYGRYALGMAAISIGSTVLFQWLNVGVARFYPARAREPALLLSTSIHVFKLIAGVAAALVALFLAVKTAANVVPQASVALTLAVLAGAVGMGLLNLHLQIVNARGEPQRYGLITATRATATLIAAVLIVKAGLGADAAVAATAVGSLLAVLCFGARWQQATPARDPALQTELVRYGLPLSLTYVSVVVVDVSDRFLLAWWSGAAAVGGYAAAYDLAQQTAGALLNVFFLAHYPRVTTAWEAGGAAAARAAMTPLAHGLLLVAPLVCGGFIGLAPEIAAVMFGPALREGAATVMPWIAVAVTLGALRAFLFDIAFHVTKASLVQLRVIGAMALANLALNVVLIPRYGALGAAVSAALACALGTAASAWWGRAAGIYPPMLGNLLKALLVTAVTAAVLRATHTLGADFLGLGLRGLAGLLVFALSALATNLAGCRGLVSRLRL